jgi:hypothetical protein
MIKTGVASDFQMLMIDDNCKPCRFFEFFKSEDFKLHSTRGSTLLCAPLTPLLVCFYVPWCPSCGKLAKQMDYLSNKRELQGRLRCLLVSADGNVRSAEKFSRDNRVDWIKHGVTEYVPDAYCLRSVVIVLIFTVGFNSILIAI